MPPKQWTPEERAAQADKMRAAHASRRTQDATAPPPAAADIVPAPAPAPVPATVAPHRARSKPSPSVPAAQSGVPASAVGPATPSPIDVSALTTTLQSLPLDSLSYADCGLLLNALAAASNQIATRRRQAQEQVEAGTMQATCDTCHRLIDISKSGGYQILTVRDEHFQPKNVFFCSQGCLLARNLPSHEKRTPKQKKEGVA